MIFLNFSRFGTRTKGGENTISTVAPSLSYISSAMRGVDKECDFEFCLPPKFACEDFSWIETGPYLARSIYYSCY